MTLNRVIPVTLLALLFAAPAQAISYEDAYYLFEELTLETNSIIVQSVLGLAYCLGFVAGSMR